MSYSIWSYCTDNYRDALALTEPSWRATASAVTICRGPACDWLEGIDRKLAALAEFVAAQSFENLVVLDADVYAVRSVDEVFDRRFDVGATRLFAPSASGTANIGVVFLKNTSATRDFVARWLKTAEACRRRGEGIRPHEAAFDQIAFTRLARAGHLGKIPVEVCPFDEQQYNSECNDDDRWVERIGKDKPDLLHFKRGRFRDPHLVRRVLEAAR